MGSNSREDMRLKVRLLMTANLSYGQRKARSIHKKISKAGMYWRRV